jgi:glycosyltransferase involved in cell wall biosynthesis
MSRPSLVSIVINNHNYARFLGAAIESALGQTYSRVEVIVVDDGSTDESRDVIAAYGDEVVPLLKANGGQDSAVNAGFGLARGDVVCFLDSDDLLFPTAADRAAGLLADPALAKVHWPLEVVNPAGRRTGQRIPAGPLAEGDLREVVRARGPGSYTTPPTSGNAWARRFLGQVFPIPEMRLKSGTADSHLSALAPLFGPIARIEEPLGAYRVHGGNLYWGRTVEKLPQALEAHDRQCRELAVRFARLGVAVDPARWRDSSWLHRLDRALAELEAIVPDGDVLILVDEDQWAMPDVVRGRRRLPFPERDGQYWGRPADDAAAIRELARLRSAGAHFIAFAWPAFWWLDHYRAFARHLVERYGEPRGSELVRVFDLRPPSRVA